MTLADERRAIAEGISTSRASTASASRESTSAQSRAASAAAISAGRASTSQAARRAIGASLEEQRRGKTLQQDLNSLQPGARRNKALSAREATGGRPQTAGTGVWDPATPSAGGAGGGIASPLTETAYTDRQYHPDQTLVSTDGILSFKVKPIKQITQKDANDNEVIQIFAAPVITP